MLVGRWLAGVGLVALAGAAVGVYGVASASERDVPAVGRGVGPAVGPATVVTTETPGAAKQGTKATDPVLSGKRRVTIVRVGAFESGLSLLDGGRLAEVDDDRGRQVFVPTPLGKQEFLIKSYYGGGTGQPVCWQAYNPGNAQPLVVRGATCRAGDPRQRFVIAPAAGGGAREFVISNQWAYLRTSARSGLILEELGDAPPASSFRFNDTGPAPRRG
ncbi:hypothetical protein C1I95_22085 [Micromonospora craterilacus]|uniref:Ricin B lectin domain-containing protein n=1 Tax=Micromonospora craterilacus TaxID=1655439 RepID=A0A2W2FFK1_9ACTN|nr:hypothetical protein [Micromonospora craterilacus]PZG14254.1 hypothetical protein C1I95_22085 [Micromonospora craterilacus]